MQNLDISIWKNKDAKKKYPCTFIHSKILDHSRQKTNSFFPLKNDPFFFQSDFQTLYFSGFSLFYKKYFWGSSNIVIFEMDALQLYIPGRKRMENEMRGSK